MEFKEVVKNRYSCKKYSGRKVEAEKLAAILEAGRVAPTAKNLQEQRVYVVQSEEMLAKIDGGGKRDSGVEDATIVATHMILAAADEGVDSCWVNFFDPEKMEEVLGLPENEEILMVMDLGYAAEGAGPLPNHSSRKPLSETVSYM